MRNGRSTSREGDGASPGPSIPVEAETPKPRGREEEAGLRLLGLGLALAEDATPTQALVGVLVSVLVNVGGDILVALGGGEDRVDICHLGAGGLVVAGGELLGNAGLAGGGLAERSRGARAGGGRSGVGSIGAEFEDEVGLVAAHVGGVVVGGDVVDLLALVVVGGALDGGAGRVRGDEAVVDAGQDVAVDVADVVPDVGRRVGVLELRLVGVVGRLVAVDLDADAAGAALAVRLVVLDGLVREGDHEGGRVAHGLDVHGELALVVHGGDAGGERVAREGGGREGGKGEELHGGSGRSRCLLGYLAREYREAGATA